MPTRSASESREPGARLLILCGLPFSGKTTYARYRRAPGAPFTVICPDDIRLSIYGNEFFKAGEPFVWATAEAATRALLRSGHKVIIDATNTTPSRRRPWIEIAREFDIEPEVLVILAPTIECIARARQAKREDMVSVIIRMAERWVDPQPDFEHASITYVKADGEGYQHRHHDE